MEQNENLCAKSEIKTLNKRFELLKFLTKEEIDKRQRVLFKLQYDKGQLKHDYLEKEKEMNELVEIINEKDKQIETLEEKNKEL